MGTKQTPETIAKRVATRKANGWFKDPEAVGKAIAAGRATGKRADRAGPKNPAWKGGISKLPQGWRGSAEYKAWRLGVLDRAGHRCQRCGSDRFVIAHHIKDWHQFPALRLAPENGEALCRKCHAHEHSLVDHLPQMAGQWEGRPAVTTIVCRICGAPRHIRTCDVGRTVTCGSRQCKRERLRQGLIGHLGGPGEANHNYRHGRYVAVPHVCAHCGVHFDGPSSRKFCSATCSGLSKKGQGPHAVADHVCPHCGRHFQGAKTRHYCSRSCAPKGRHVYDEET